MDPSSYPRRDTSFIQSDDTFTPLHQDLWGQTTMPTLSSSVPNAHAPKEPNMLLNNDYSFQTYYSNIDAPPPQPHPVFTQPPPTSTITSARFQSPAENEQELMHTFLTIPVGKFLRDKTATLHAHLDIVGALDPGPIFQDPSSDILKEMRKPLASSSSHCDPYEKMSYVKPTYLGQSPMTYHVQREQQVLSTNIPSGNINYAIGATMNSAFEFSEVQHYTCKLCNATFTTPQTYHGHMSLHNKGLSSN
ncbi:hypothetical protein PVAP13_5NG389900 [Panicum virgatum]|uniref:C2H2-type domain-containing protein n=1 Tax=Panicum virgatum TaxID=38727 RepID=A0A8T0RWZ3_PANVG|nr:hypothetical protein PVAP13_5NG389900 [Panicum virgatum]